MKLVLKFLGGLVLVIVVAVGWNQFTRPPIAPAIPVAVFPVNPVSGAAVFYNQALAAMPELSEEEKKLINTKQDQPLEIAGATKLAARFEPSLKLLERGAKEQGCDWGLDMNRGPVIPFPHAKGLSLIQIMRLPARVHLMNRNASAAVDDLLLSLRFGHHLGEPGFLISNLLRVSADMVVIDFAARHLPEFDAASLQKLSDGIATLPPSHSMREAVMFERMMVPTYLRRSIVKDAERRERHTWFERLKQVFQASVLTKQNGNIASIDPLFVIPEVAEIVKEKPSVLVSWINDIERDEAELERLMALPYAEGRPKIAALMKRVEEQKESNPLAAMTIPAVGGLRDKEVQMEAVWTIFLTALNAQIHNPRGMRAELEKLRDPYDNGPIDCRDVEGGVELKLKAAPDKKRLTLTVGLPKK